LRIEDSIRAFDKPPSSIFYLQFLVLGSLFICQSGRPMPEAINRAIRRAAGGVVYRYAGDAALILLIRDKYGRWTLPKGHLEPGESEAAAAIREVHEETGVTGELGLLVSRIAYTVMKNGVLRPKEVAFFLLRATSGQATPQADEGIAAAEWYVPERAIELVGYPQVREVLGRALEMLDLK
jgi:8-oxo-dGTP pyrophosphatase MutT (NUDIX family)